LTICLTSSYFNARSDLLEREACDDSYLSANRSGEMSNSRMRKTNISAALLATIVAVAVAGCGQKQDAGPAARPATTQATAAASAPSRRTTTPTPEEADVAPVDLTLEDGGFARSTPKVFHVPSGFIVVIAARNASDAKIRLSVSSPTTAQTFKVSPGKTQSISLASIGAKDSAKLISGGRTIRIAADAEPGP
jgi:hypothetical protein